MEQKTKVLKDYFKARCEVIKDRFSGGSKNGKKENFIKSKWKLTHSFTMDKLFLWFHHAGAN